MPCYDSRNDANTAEGQAEMRKAFRHNSDVAELLCGILRYVETTGPIFNTLQLPAPVRQWWAEHKERDAKKMEVENARKRRAESRQKALGKLTAKERRLLGL